MVAFIQLDFAWWWLFAVFLLWDLSMVGYIASPRVGAISYNVGHSYLGPAALLALTWAGDARWPAFVALTWAFHIAVDRLLGYGLKFTDRFTHTHLGEMGSVSKHPPEHGPIHAASTTAVRRSPVGRSSSGASPSAWVSTSAARRGRVMVGRHR
ncbi:DUF4260 domain-containing protein [Georgenia sp. M64]|uniref:DUF4260 domain-containing protein n=1 Tax=Georgenia sp. M64 TaxID=3120520 RepID=UPI0030E287A3